MKNLNNHSVETKIQVALEVLKTDKTKSSIADEFGVSIRSVGRWFDKYQNDAQTIIDEENKKNVVDDATKIKKSVIEKEKKILEDYYAKKDDNLVEVDRRFKRGAPKKGCKSIRHIVLEVMEEYKGRGELTKENRVKITQELSDKIGHEYQRCNWYFLVYKKVLGGYQD